MYSIRQEQQEYIQYSRMYDFWSLTQSFLRIRKCVQFTLLCTLIFENFSLQPKHKQLGRIACMESKSNQNLYHKKRWRWHMSLQSTMSFSSLIDARSLIILAVLVRSLGASAPYCSWLTCCCCLRLSGETKISRYQGLHETLLVRCLVLVHLDYGTGRFTTLQPSL